MKSFNISISTDFAEWTRYRVYLTAVCFDAQDEQIDYVATESSELVTPACHHAELHLYIVAAEFPTSTSIAASPPFEVTITVNGTILSSHPVNQWGGLSVKQRLA